MTTAKVIPIWTHGRGRAPRPGALATDGGWPDGLVSQRGEVRSGVGLVTLDGVLLRTSMSDYTTVLGSVLRRRPPVVVLDVREVACGGDEVAVLDALRRHAGRHGAQAVLAAPSAALLTELADSGLRQSFQVFRARDVALDQVRRHPAATATPSAPARPRQVTHPR